MSSCLSGGGRAYRLDSLDLEIIKSPSTSWISNSSSPSSTLSESSNCPLAISTRKPRTPRKRPNQTYNEAAALLSTAYPKIFPTKHLTKFTKPHNCKNPFSLEPSDLLIPFPTIDNSEFLLRRPHFNLFEKPCLSPGEINSSSEICDEYHQDDIDAESILDEEIGEGIDSIIGKNEPVEDLSSYNAMNNCCYGYPVGLGFEFGYGVRRELRAMRNVDEGDWWRFPSVNVADITPKTSKIPAEKKKKKGAETIKNSEPAKEKPIPTLRSNKEENSAGKEECVPQQNGGLLLKLNYDGVLNAWSDKGSPFSGDAQGAESAGGDVQARLAQIDLFSDNGGMREASVLRYKEKRRTRLFSKKIRYQVRKVNADRRPRMKEYTLSLKCFKKSNTISSRVSYMHTSYDRHSIGTLADASPRLSSSGESSASDETGIPPSFSRLSWLSLERDGDSVAWRADGIRMYQSYEELL
ncbi:protein CHLOROPLAST IMPORT APPARATUS 2 [Sesamum alatum]|uniref:Protein CHLOROPLAST IMPORT APPARATUS 2 n=1 Tax=Sesamum alatum TaxID=300844 RepID=A0AAE1XMZ4_9LAMI|nr:protein CHLOROPLAST IMPORT APPARATUS 2 [Sesamum alatum]